MPAITPFPDPRLGQENTQRGWLGRNGWRIGFLALVFGSGYLWGRRRERRGSISVDSVSEDWLAQHEFDAGRDHTT